MLVHLFAVLVALSTAVLIFAGGLVTSTGSGLSVPDWPNTYGWFMFAFPLEKMVGGIRYEHTHRLIASTVGFLIMVLAFLLWRTEPRAWVRRLGFLALAAVITQGILGGITVLWFLPDPISIAHASLAQLVFCMTVTIALVTSRGWKRGYGVGSAGPNQPPLSELRSAEALAKAEGPALHGPAQGLQRMTVVATVVIYLQILIGATMRHTDAGLAIPDFPLAFGGLLPPQWDAKIAVHFAHRIGALIVTLLILATAIGVFRLSPRRVELRRTATLLLMLLPIQITLGAMTVLLNKPFIINSLHVVTGASVLVVSLVLALRANRSRFHETFDTRVGRAA